MKKLMSVFIAATLVFTFAIPAFSTEMNLNESSQITIEAKSDKWDDLDPYYQTGGKENYLKMKEFDAQKEATKSFAINPNTIIDSDLPKLIEESLTPSNSYGSIVYFSQSSDGNYGYFRNENWHEQINSYYCGPATVANALEIINGTSANQTYYGNNMLTNSTDGTFVYRLTNELNARQNENTYGWREIEWDASRLWDPVIIDTATNNVPLAVMCYTNHLNAYNGHRLNHFLLVTGFYGRYYGTKSLYYTDSWDDSSYNNNNTLGEKSDTLSNFMNGTTYLIW